MTTANAPATASSPGVATLTQLIKALDMLGISVIPPAQEITRKEAAAAAAVLEPTPAMIVAKDAQIAELIAALESLGIHVPDATKPSGSTPVAGAATSSNEDDSELTPNGFVCVACHTYNSIRSSKEPWYAVTSGRDVGVFKDWHLVHSLVSGVNASYRKYSTEASAREAFNEAIEAGVVNVIT